jgi:hypothetical protein
VTENHVEVMKISACGAEDQDIFCHVRTREERPIVEGQWAGRQ